MSFRELRNFAEIMRELGYDSVITLDNFRTPNFELVANILDFLVEKYDPSAHIDGDIDTERSRVRFIKSIVEFVYSKAGIKMNPKKLYAADGKSVRELLKMATVLRDSLRLADSSPTSGATDGNGRGFHSGGPAGGNDSSSLDQSLDDSQSNIGGSIAFDANSNTLPPALGDLKYARQLASDIVESGSKLHELLGYESSMRSKREKALNFLEAVSSRLDRNSEQEYVEKALQDCVEEVTRNYDALEEQHKELQKDVDQMNKKIKKKTHELERTEKRLQSLQTVRPAFMDEYERLEAELQTYYDAYLERFRNLDYLEHELQTYKDRDLEQAGERDRRLKKLQHKLAREKELELRGDNRGSGRYHSSGYGSKRSDSDDEQDDFDEDEEHIDDRDRDLNGDESMEESGSSLGMSGLSENDDESAASSNTMVMSDDEEESGELEGDDGSDDDDDF